MAQASCKMGKILGAVLWSYPQNQACDMFSFEFLEAKYSPTIIMGDYFASRNLNGTVETFP